jgi:hypothetical protein
MPDIIVLCISCCYTFSFVLMHAVIFYFANRSHSMFEFELNSNRFAIYKRFENRKVSSILKPGHGPFSFSPLNQAHPGPFLFSRARPSWPATVAHLPFLFLSIFSPRVRPTPAYLAHFLVSLPHAPRPTRRPSCSPRSTPFVLLEVQAPNTKENIGRFSPMESKKNPMESCLNHVRD